MGRCFSFPSQARLLTNFLEDRRVDETMKAGDLEMVQGSTAICAMRLRLFGVRNVWAASIVQILLASMRFLPPACNRWRLKTS